LEQLQDKSRELDTLTLASKARRAELDQRLTELEDSKVEFEARAVQLEEKSEEVDRLHKKISLMEKEHAHALELLGAEKDELKQQIQKGSEQRRKGDQKDDSPGTLSGLDAAKYGVAPLQLSGGYEAELKKMRVNYESLMRALKKKCDAYMGLQLIHQESKEQMSRLEKDLKAANKKLEHQSERKIKELETKLAKSQEICEKLFQSGMYWRQRRSKDGHPKIRIPIQGGGGAKRKLASGVLPPLDEEVLQAVPAPVAFTSDALLSPTLPSHSFSISPPETSNKKPDAAQGKIRRKSRENVRKNSISSETPSDPMDHFF